MTTRGGVHTSILCAAVLAAGCSSGRLVGPFPSAADPSRTASIVVARPYQFVGAMITLRIRVDGAELAALGTDEHVVIPVAPGERSVAVKTPDPGSMVTLVHPTLIIQAEPGRTYYFRVEPDRIERTTEAEGRELVSRTKALAQASANTVR